MCSKEEAKTAANDAIEETLFTPDVNGHTLFARQVHDAVFEEGAHGEPSRFQRELRKGFYNTFGKWFFGGGALLIVAVAGMYFQLQSNTKTLEEGGRYTENDAIEDKRLKEARDQRQDEDIQNLREEINKKLDILLTR